MEALRLGDVQETALIPLAIRASETKRKNARITDQKAVEIMERLGVDTKKYDKYASHEGVVYRTIMIDREVKRTISRHTDAVCVNLGCGLDDRFTRVDNGIIRWFNVDLPDAIEVRRKVFADTERYKSIVGDILDPEWIKQIPKAKETIVVAEGLFMYFTREQIQTILRSLTDNFPRGYLFVELMHPKMMNEKRHDTIKTTRAHFGWGTTSGKDLLPLDDKLSLIKEISISDEMKAAGGLSKLFGTIIGNLNNRLDVYTGVKREGRKQMERYDISTPITFKKGYYRFCEQANFNFQLNRVIMWDGGRKEDIDEIGAGITSSEKWVGGMRLLAERAHREGRTENEIAYRRMTEFFMYDSDPKKKRTYEDAAALFYEYYRDYFDKGVVTRTQVPYGKGYLPVMSAKAKAGKPIDTILLHGGNDSYFEEFFFAMLYLAERGFDVYLFEGPGQGGVLRVQDMKFDYRWERPVKAVLDYFGIKEAAIIGASLGGYLAPRAAAFEPRIRRVVGWSIFPDFFDVVIADHPGAMRAVIGGVFKLGLGKAMNGMYEKMMKQDELVRWNLLHGMYAYDAKTPDEYVQRIRKFTLKGVADRITQDVLILGAREDHFIMPKLFHEEYDLLTNVRSLTLNLFTDKQCAGAHCNVGNTKLALDTMADWIIRKKARED